MLNKHTLITYTKTLWSVRWNLKFYDIFLQLQEKEALRKPIFYTLRSQRGKDNQKILNGN